MTNKKISYDNLPEAVDFLIQEISKIKEFIFNQKPIQDKNMPIGIDEASLLLGKAKSTIYTLVQKNMIPCYKIGKKLYFYEKELLDWIATGRKKNVAQIKIELEKEAYKNVRHKPRVLNF